MTLALRRALPSCITLGSFGCGLAAIALSVAPGEPGALRAAALLIILAVVCDLLDGIVARALDAAGPFGAELDSLSDVVAFGVAPAILVWRWQLSGLGVGGFVLAFGFAACGVLRLARYNVTVARDEQVHRDSVGLTVPMAAVTLAAAVLADVGPPEGVAVMVAALAVLMVSRAPYPTFKGMPRSGRNIAILLGLALGAAGLGVAFGPAGALLVSVGAYGCLGPVVASWRRFPLRSRDQT